MYSKIFLAVSVVTLYLTFTMAGTVICWDLIILTAIFVSAGILAHMLEEVLRYSHR